MSVITNCTTCGRELRAKDQYAGQRTRCPDCGTINRLPSKPDGCSRAESPLAGTPEGVCRLCGRDFLADRDRVKDVKGRFYHRRCYETALRQRQAKGDSTPRKAPAASNEAAYPGLGSPKRQSRSRLPETDPAPKPPANAAPASNDPWSELGSPLDSGDALWGDDLLITGDPLSGGDLGLTAGVSLQMRPSRSRLEPTTRFLIGIGATLPIVLAIVIIISIATRSDRSTETDRSTQSVATAETAMESPAPREAEVPPSVPPIHRLPSHRAAPARGATSPEIPTDTIAAIGMVLGILAVFLTVGLLIAAATLRTACSMCNVNEPSFGKAMLISLALLIPAPLLMCVPLMGANGGPEQALFAILVMVGSNMAVTGFIYGKCLRTTFGKGILICVAQMLVQFLVSLVICVVLFVIGLLFGGIALLTS